MENSYEFRVMLELTKFIITGALVVYLIFGIRKDQSSGDEMVVRETKCDFWINHIQNTPSYWHALPEEYENHFKALKQKELEEFINADFAKITQTIAQPSLTYWEVIIDKWWLCSDIVDIVILLN